MTVCKFPCVCVIMCSSLHSEINLFWAAHQMHHSSQDYTLSTALRQSVMQRFGSWVNICIPTNHTLYACSVSGLSPDCSFIPELMIHMYTCSNPGFLNSLVPWLLQDHTMLSYLYVVENFDTNFPLHSLQIIQFHHALNLYIFLYRCFPYRWLSSCHLQCVWFTSSSTCSTSFGFIRRWWTNWALWNGFSTLHLIIECITAPTPTALTRTMVRVLV